MSFSARLSDFMQRNGVGVGLYILVAVFFWLLLLIVLPQLTMLDFSFRPNLVEAGSPEDVYTLEHYQYFLFGSEGNPDGWNVLDIRILFKTMLVALFVTIIDLAICYPIAYILAQSATASSARLMLLALILPYWINEILRAFAFRILFGTTGLINTVLVGLGIVDDPVNFIGLDVALYSGLAYAYILLMIFPLYNAIESLDKNQIEAARDMGASWLQVHWKIVIPFAKPGIASGSTMVFMLTAGALAAPQILGGPSSLWFTQVIYQWFTQGNNWPRGSAYAIMLLIVCVVFVFTAMRLFKVKVGEIGR